MADAKGAEIIPFPGMFGYGGYSIGEFTLDQSTDAVEFVFPAEEDITATTVLIRQGVETGDDTSVYRVSIQSIDSSGNPSGTILGATSNGYGDYTATTAKNNSIGRVTLGESVSLTRGTWYAVVVKYQSGTALSAGVQQCNFARAIQHSTSSRGIFTGYSTGNNAGTRARTSTVQLFGIASASRVYGCPVKAVGGHTYRADTAGYDEYGVRFSLPAAWGDTFKLKGAILYWDMPGAGTTIDLTLWDNASPPVSLQTVSIDSDLQNFDDSYWQRIPFSTGTLPTLSFGTTYNLTLFNNSTSSNMILRYLDVDAAGDWSAMPWGDITMSQIARLNAASSFDELTTRRPCIGLWLEDWTEPSGGGGGGIVVGTSGVIVRGAA